MEEPIWPSIGEQLTPYKLALGILLHAYVTTKDEICEECLHEAEEVSQVNMNSHSSFDVYANFAVVFVNMLRGADNRTLEIEPSLSDITNELEEKLKVGNYGLMFSKFLQNRLHKINSPDDLMDLLSSFTRLLSKDDDDEDDMNGLNPNRPTHIAPRSIFGIFVRRIVLAVNKMLFDSVANLFNDVKKFLEDDRATTTTTTNNSGIPTNINESSNSINDFLHTHVTHFSPREMQQALYAKVKEVERGINMKSFHEIEREIENILIIAPNLPQAYFLRYLNCLGHQEYEGATESLHQYFDYALHLHDVKVNNIQKGPDGEYINIPRRGRRHKIVVQYAVLNLAAMQFHFGRLEEALLAVNETIRVAQQNGDHRCVTLALSWLYRIKAAQRDVRAPRLLKRCIERSSELKLNELNQLMQFAKAEYELNFPSLEHENVFDTESRDNNNSNNNNNDNLESRDAILPNLIIQGKAGSQEKNRGSSTTRNVAVETKEDDDTDKIIDRVLSTSSIHSLSSRMHMLRSSAWDTLGNETLSTLGLQLKLLCHSNEGNTSVYDTVLALCKLAHLQVRSSGFLNNIGEVIEPRKMKGNISYVHAIALDTLALARKLYPQIPGTTWPHATASLLFDAAKNRMQVNRAYSLCRQMIGLSYASHGADGTTAGSSDSNNNDPTMYVGSNIRFAQYLSMVGRVEEAYSTYFNLLDFCTRKRLHVHEAVVLLEIARLVLNCVKATGNAPYALPFLMRCLSLSKTLSLSNLEADAIVLLAATHLQMGNAGRARSLLLSKMTQIMGSGSPDVQARAKLCYAKCLFGTASTGLKHTSSLSSRSKDLLRKDRSNVLKNSSPALSSFQNIAEEALQCLWRSISGFEALQDYSGMREGLYLLARVYNELPGREDDRNFAAQRFMEVDRLIRRAHVKGVETFHSLHSITGLDRMVDELKSV